MQVRGLMVAAMVATALCADQAIARGPAAIEGIPPRASSVACRLGQRLLLRQRVPRDAAQFRLSMQRRPTLLAQGASAPAQGPQVAFVEPALPTPLAFRLPPPLA